MMRKITYEGKGKQITFLLQNNPKLLNTQSKLYGNSNHVGQVQVHLHINTHTLFIRKPYINYILQQYVLQAVDIICSKFGSVHGFMKQTINEMQKIKLHIITHH
jgi:uncharacterized protein Usg